MKSKSLHKIFHGKILLFGEHIINKRAKGLAIPVEGFHGLLKYGSVENPDVRVSNKSLHDLANHIIHHEGISKDYDTNLLLDDIEKGLYFDSNIPQGFGLGSSGALVAAIYQRYSKHSEKTKESLTLLKNGLSLIENYFHGKSSGLDATVCYLNKGVILDNGEVSGTFEFTTEKTPQLQLILINTHIPRSTSKYVNLFLSKYEDPKFKKIIESSLVPATNLAIEGILKKDYKVIWSSLKLISQIQFDLLPEFIPEKFKKIWKIGLSGNEFHLKLSGAGGGGFIIGFAKADARLDILLEGFDVISLMKF